MTYSKTALTVGDGRYTFIIDKGRVSIQRFGEEWTAEAQDMPCPNALITIICELEEARLELAKCHQPSKKSED